MFRGCQNLQKINGLNNWNVSNANSFRDMFFGCKNLKNLDEFKACQFYKTCNKTSDLRL